MNEIERRYWKSIDEMPTRGSGLHQHLPRITNYAVMLGLSREQTEYDVSSRNPSVYATLRRTEIKEAYAFSERSVTRMDFDKPRDPYARYARGKRAVEEPAKALSPKDVYVDATLMDIMEASPIRLLEPPSMDGYIVLETLYARDEFVFIGDTYSKSPNVLTVNQWLQRPADNFPFIMLNPLTGEYGHTSEGRESKRCEEAVKVGRYLLLEMDGTPRDEQVGIIMGMIERGWPVALVVDSGNKSLHTWVHVDCPKEQWEERIRKKVFEGTLAGFGIDPACKNISRLSRFGGHLRKQTGRRQTVYYLKEF